VIAEDLHASVRRALRQAWELDDAARAERLIRNLAQRLKDEAPRVVAEKSSNIGHAIQNKGKS
jgi:hypothetical protein